MLKSGDKMSKEMPCEVWSRVVGFYRPKSECNPGKKSELEERKLFDVNNKKKNYPRWKKDLTLSKV